MANQSIGLALLLATVLAAATTQNPIAPRMIGGIPIDTLRRFPHHVTIEPETYYANNSLCGGSILSEQWVLTSARCVDQSRRLKLHFERLYLNNTVGSYTAIVNNDAITVYPTYYDDIAMVKLPFKLVFSDTLKPIGLNQVDVASLQDKLTVLPGFDTVNYNSDQLTYGMFNIIPAAQCNQYYKYEYDEYLQMCAVGWSNSANSPCMNDQGAGLVIGWPAKSELVGIYSGGGECGSGYPGIYTNIAKYVSWINSFMNPSP